MMAGTVLGIDSRVAYTVLVAAIAIQRLWELRVSRRHVRALRARGAIEVGGGHYPWMVLLHIGFLLSCLAEVWLLERPWRPALAVVAVSILAAALALRWWTLGTLGERWTTRVLVVPGEELVSDGPYRWLRHPNYLVVALEILSIPLVHGAWLTAIIFSAANGVLLRERLRVENGALEELASRSAG
jgi:methyltransferase